MASGQRALAGVFILLVSACAHHEAQRTSSWVAPPPPAPAPAPAPAPEPAPAASAVEAPLPAAPAGPLVELPKLVQTGATFVEDMTTKDGKDTYFVSVDGMKRGVAWTWKAGEDDSAAHGSVKTSDAWLKSASEVVFFSQGAISPSGKKAKAVPPFLLSRNAAKALRAGKAAKLSVFDVKDAEVKPDGNEVKSIVVDGTPSTVSTLRATDGKTTFWFADDPKWPVLVAASFDDGNSIELKEVRTKK